MGLKSFWAFGLSGLKRSCDSFEAVDTLTFLNEILWKWKLTAIY